MSKPTIPLDEMSEAALRALMQKAEPKLALALAQHGVESPDQLPAEIARKIFQETVIQTAVESFPGAQVDALEHGMSSFQHPLFSQAFGRLRKQLALPSDAFMVAAGVDAAIVLAGFGLPVAPFDRKQPRILAEPSNDIDKVAEAFARFKTAYVGYSPCDVPFYIVVTDCVKSMPSQIESREQLAPLREVLQGYGELVLEKGLREFQHGIVLVPRSSGETISTVFLSNPNVNEGSIGFFAGWKVGDVREGAPNDGFVPVPLQFLKAACKDPQIAMWIWKPAGVQVAIN